MIYGTEEKLAGPVAFQLHAGTQPVDGKLLAFLRLFCMDKDALGKEFDERKKEISRIKVTY